MSAYTKKVKERLHGSAESNTVEMVFAHGSGYHQAQQDALKKAVHDQSECKMNGKVQLLKPALQVSKLL